MQHKDLKNFARLMYEMAVLYPCDLTAPMCALYWRDLQCYSFEQIWQAWEQHRQDPMRGRFAPKPADFIYFIHEQCGDQATMAWQTVISALQKLGPYHSEGFKDPLIGKVIQEMGGMWSLNRLTHQQLQRQESRFLASYRRFTHRQGRLPLH